MPSAALRLLLVVGALLSCLPFGPATAADQPLTCTSPDGRLEVHFRLQDGRPTYRATWDGAPIIAPSALGLTFRTGAPLDRALSILKVERAETDETWDLVWGEFARARDHHREMRITLTTAGENPRYLEIVFRVFADGFGFRYGLPPGNPFGDFQIMSEVTEFNIAGEARAWWIPAFGKERYEYLYRCDPVRDLDMVHTPLTIEMDAGPVLAIHEANLTDYSAMALAGDGRGGLRCALFPWPGGAKVVGRTPFASPWRTVQVGDRPGDLVASPLVLNLNPPSRLDDTSWIEPGKYVGIWWGMHLGTMTWGSGPRHGATTDNALRYIDFAAENGFAGVLVEGWNPGWDGNWWGHGEDFRFTESHPDFDLEKVAAYAAAHGVTLIGHHETAADIRNYETQMEEAFALYERLGVRAVKTGYVAHMCDGDQWHHGQFMVRHYRKVVETAARHRVMVDVHEPIKDTGIRRTWPNMMTREGARGQEYNAWSGDGGNPPEHTTILPFTRTLAGPFDFTPGIFDLLYPEARPRNRVNTTLAKQLALYVIIYSPLQMAADLPENYVDQPAFQFIRDVPCDWAETRVIEGAIGDHVTMARRDRHSACWYLGSITDEQARHFSVPLDFLDEGRTYRAEVYADGPGAHWEENPYPLTIASREVNRDTVLEIRLAAGGGQAVRLVPLP